MEIKRVNDGFVLTREEESFKLSWAEFWQISRLADCTDAKNDIEEYLNDANLYFFNLNSKYTMEEISNNEELMGEIVNKLLAIRVKSEKTEDIHEAIVSVCGAGCLSFE